MRVVIPGWLQPAKHRFGSLVLVCVLLVFASALLLSGSPDERRISLYSKVANYSLPVVERNRQDYVGLLEVLEPLGTVSAKISGGVWKLRYSDVDSEFTAGKKRARIRNGDFDLPANFLLENGRGLVPLSGLGELLSRILGGPVTLNQGARRLFIGNVAVHFTAQVGSTTPPSLVMNFSSPVNPTIATEPGRLRMVFNHEPVVAPGSQTLTFSSKLIPSASFAENNGVAEIVVSSTAPVMASFSNDGRTITIALPQPAQTQTLPLSGVPAAGQVSPMSPVPSSSPRTFVVVDAAHGGAESGAALTPLMLEKDVTLSFARVLRQQLEARGLPTMLLRDGDTTLTADQRAGMTNSAAPAIYLCLHAASQGSGVHIYTAITSATAENRGPFLDWSAAQVAFVGTSQVAGGSIAAELRSKQLPVRTLLAPLRPLNNITTAAAAIEVAPSDNDVNQLNSSDYQQLVMSAVAAGVANIRDQLQAGRK